MILKSVRPSQLLAPLDYMAAKRGLGKPSSCLERFASGILPLLAHPQSYPPTGWTLSMPVVLVRPAAQPAAPLSQGGNPAGTATCWGHHVTVIW